MRKEATDGRGPLLRAAEAAAGRQTLPWGDRSACCVDDVVTLLRDALAKAKDKPGARELYPAAIAHFLFAGQRAPVGYKELRRLLKGLSQCG